jgi:hypothetical protein
MMAEVIYHHFPKIIELHNYPPTNSLKSKLSNWATLNSTSLRNSRQSAGENRAFFNSWWLQEVEFE